jgi:hypothetical protein
MLCFIAEARTLLSNSTLHFSGAQATGAGVNPFRGTINNRLNTPYIDFPGSSGTPVRMGNLFAESNFLAANITFCHLSAPPSKGLLAK